MIIKIKRIPKVCDQEWWILDNIHKISKATYKIKFNEEDVSADIYIMDYKETLDTLDSKYYVTYLICKGDNTSDEFSIVFDTEAYIMNDHGETIEIIRCNN